MSEWISVEDRLPKYGEPVLLVFSGVVQHVTYALDGADKEGEWVDFFELYYFSYDNGVKLSLNEVSHWMNLPEPPK